MMKDALDLYNSSPQFVLGFHGCEQTVADKILINNEMLVPSTNDYDWLGSGIYFWEQNYQRAWEWALECQKRKGASYKPAVIGAIIDLGLCLDLLNSSSIHELQQHAITEILGTGIVGNALPKNTYGEDKILRRLDCAMIEGIHNERKANGQPAYDSVRAVFTEGKELYPGAGFKEKSHIQLCVRNPNCIKGFFAPRNIDPNWSIPH